MCISCCTRGEHTRNRATRRLPSISERMSSPTDTTRAQSVGLAGCSTALHCELEQRSGSTRFKESEQFPLQSYFLPHRWLSLELSTTSHCCLECFVRCVWLANSHIAARIHQHHSLLHLSRWFFAVAQGRCLWDSGGSSIAVVLDVPLVMSGTHTLVVPVLS